MVIINEFWSASWVPEDRKDEMLQNLSDRVFILQEQETKLKLRIGQLIHEYECLRRKRKPEIDKVIFNPPATVVFWSGGTKTVVKCHADDEFDEMVGLAMAISKKFFGNVNNYMDTFKKICKESPKERDTLRSTNSILMEKFTELVDSHKKLVEDNIVLRNRAREEIKKSEELQKENNRLRKTLSERESSIDALLTENSDLIKEILSRKDSYTV